MARKHDRLTPRQKQSRRIMREKAARKKRRELFHKLQWFLGSMAAVAMVAGGVWLWRSGVIERTAQAVSDGAYRLTADAGFSLQALYLEGRNRTSMDDIDKALAVKKGDPILKLSLDELRQRLESIESVRHAAVERELPGKLYVRIVEREPVALWQHKGKIRPVDDNGVVMSGIDSGPYKHLPLIVGDEAPRHVGELVAMLALEPELAGRFAAAVYVGQRRWNIRLKDNIEIRLPEKDPIEAWQKLAELHSRQQLLDRDVKVIDLRVAGRLFIKVAPAAEAPEKTATAKET